MSPRRQFVRPAITRSVAKHAVKEALEDTLKRSVARVRKPAIVGVTTSKVKIKVPEDLALPWLQILKERIRHINEGRDAVRDLNFYNTHVMLARAAAAYACAAAGNLSAANMCYPWNKPQPFKGHYPNARRDLEISGSLVLAAMQVLDLKSQRAKDEVADAVGAALEKRTKKKTPIKRGRQRRG